MKRLLLLISLCFLVTSIFSQVWKNHLPQHKTESELTYFDYKTAFDRWCEELKIDAEGYYINSKGVRQKAYGWKSFKRWQIEIEGWYDDKTGIFKYEAINKEIARVRSEQSQADNIAGNWTPVAYTQEGTGNDGNGRINCVAFHPTDPDVFWVGSAWGGIWGTTDHGASWNPLSDFIMTLGIGSIAIAPDYDVTQTIYLGTGDRGYNRDRGRGILKSTDGGATWQTTGLTYNDAIPLYINRLHIIPGTIDDIVAVTDEGIFKSLDGCSTWDTISYCWGVDMEFNPADPNTFYISTRGLGRHTKILRTIDGGDNFDTVLNVYGCRTELAVSPDEPSWVYAVVSDTLESFGGFYKSTDNGATFSLVYDDKNILGGDCDGNQVGGQSDYNLALAVNPENANTVFVGGVVIWKSTDGGSTWTIAANGYDDCGVPTNVHVDIHWLEYQYGSDTLFVTSDGGIYFSPNNGNSFENISGGLMINQPYKISCSQTSEDILMGQQDNGIVLWSGGTVNFVGGGDGGTCLINPQTSFHQIFTNNSPAVTFTTDHWLTSSTFSTPGDNSDDWFKPFIILPPDTVFYGAHDLWKSTDKGYTMTKFLDLNDNTTIRRIIVAPSDHDIMLVLNDEHLWLTEDGGVSWDTIHENIPVSCKIITNIEIKETDPNVMWLAVTGWDDGKSMYRSTDMGEDWEDFSQGLPDCAWADIIQNDLQTNYDELYTCSFFGTYIRLGENPWFPFSNGLPDVVSFDIDIKYDGANSKIRTATHGRGVWESNLYSSEANMPGIWTGAYSTDWHDSRNWQYLEVPAADETVNIPGGCPYNPHIYLNNAYCTSLTLDSGAILTMSARRLYVSQDANIDGKIKMIGNAAAIFMTGDMTWGDDADFENGGTNCYIETEGDWVFESGCQANLSGINVAFKGSTYAQLFCHSSLCSFGQLTIDKPSPYNLSFKSSSIADLSISGPFIITATSKFFHHPDRKLKVAGNLDAQGDFFQQNGTFVCTSTGTINLVNSNSYFHNLELNHSGFNNLLTDIDVRGNLEVISGTLKLSTHTLNLQGDLIGTNGAIESTTGKLVFNGISEQKASGDVQVKFAVLNMTADSLRILSDADIIIDSLDWTQGAITLSENANLTINELADNGIYGVYRVRNGSTLNISNPTGRLDLNAKLYISGGTINIYGVNSTSYWPDAANAELHMSSGTLDFHDVGIYVRDHPTFTFLDNIAGGMIRTSRGFDGDHHSFNPAGGEIELYGSNNATLSHGIGSSFYKVVIDKGTATDLSGELKKVPGPSTDRARYKKAPPPANSRANKVTVNSNLDIDQTVEIESGELDINGKTVDIGSSLDISGKLTITNPSSVLDVGTSITWRNGSSSNIVEGLITFKTIWVFQEGTNAMLSGNNVVKVIGNSASTLQNKDFDACFENLEIDKTGSLTTLDEASTYSFKIDGDITVKSGNTFRIYTEDIDVAGTFLSESTSSVLLQSGGSIDAVNAIIKNTLNVVNGSILSGDNWDIQGALNLTDGGNTAFENLTLSGTLDINAGSVLVHNSFSQATGGILTLDGGSFIIDKPYTGNYMSFSGTTNLNGGFFEISYDGIQFGTGAVVNFNGGNLRIGGHFRAIQANSFQPSSGAVELINTIGAIIQCENGNYFHQLIISKNAGAGLCMLSTPVTIQDDLAIQSGELSTLNQTLIVDDDLLINTSGKLTAGSSEIYVGGNWENERGTAGFAEGTSSVTFTSAQPATLSAETFYLFDLDKSIPTGQYLAMADNSTLTVANKLTLGDGVLLMGNNCTINANGDLHFKIGGGINGNPSASGNVINVKGHWWDYNPLTTSDKGFTPGAATVIFNGTANQDLIATGGATFHHLTFQNPGNSIFINDDVTVNGNFNLVSGRWYQVGTNLTHTFKGHFTVSDASLWMDAASIVSFEGSTQQNLVSSTGGWLNFGPLQVDRPLAFSESGQMNFLSDVSCARLDIISGEAMIDSYRLMCQNLLAVYTGGYLSLENDVIVAMGSDASVHIDGGLLYIAGEVAARPLFTRISSGYYEFFVENGGSVNASFADFEYINGRGLDIYPTGFIGGSLPFNNCSFQKTEATGTLLQINNTQEITLHSINFPVNTWSGASNVKKENNAGNVNMDDATGSFAGPFYENDFYSRIHWPSAGIWEGDVSTEWHDAQNWRYNFQYPDGSTNVIIPAGVTYFPEYHLVESYINSLKILPNANLTITKDTLFVNTWADIAGQINLGDEEANPSALFCDSIIFKSSSSAYVIDRGAFYIEGNMFICRGSDLNDNQGNWYFTGNDDSRLICHDTAAINNLFNYKNAGYSLKLDGDTIAQLTVNGNFRNGPAATLKCPSTQEWVFNGNFRNNEDGSFRCENGTIKLRGSVTSTYFRVKPGDYFNNLTIESLTRLNLYTLTGYSDTLRVNGNLVINPRTGGTSGITANNFKIMLMGHWDNNASANAFDAGTSRVVFWHPWDVQEVYGNNTFNYILTANDPDGHTRFYDNNTITELVVYFPAVAYGTLNVTTLNIDDTPSEMVMMEGSNVQAGTLIQGGKVISYGGSFIVTDLDQDYVSGIYTVNNGLVSLGQIYSPTASHDLNFATITINGGELRFTGGNGVSLWPRTSGVATVTMSDGVFDLTNQEVVIKPTGFTEYITGGMIRTCWSFSADPTVTSFHPTGGTVELYGTEDCSFSMPEPNCWFHNLYLSKTDGGGAYPSSNMRVKNEFRLKTGSYMETDGYLITVGP